MTDDSRASRVSQEVGLSVTDDCCSGAGRVFQEVGQSVMTVMMPKHSQQSVPGDGPECDCDIAESAKCFRRWARV